jgi:hypothetical protein
MATSRLRRELVWAIALKLVLLFSLKFAFFPHRLAPSEASQGVVQRIAFSGSSSGEPVQKDKP